MLRSATSVTPRELRAARGHHDFGSMFIAEQLRSIWSQTAAGSPNATPGTQTAVIAVTDFFVKPMSDDGPLDQTNIQLRSRRSQTRQVALNAQKRILALHPNDASATAVG